MPRPTLLGVLKDPAVAPLFIARGVSTTGNGFGRVALAWGTLHLGYGPGGLSVALACQALPQLLLVLAGGVAGDRFPRRTVLISADLLSAVTWTGLAVCFTAGSAPLALISALAVCSGVATAMFTPAAEGIVADLVAGDRRPAANAVLRQSTSTGLILGLAVSGVTVATVGPAWAAAANAVSFAASAVLLSRLRLPPRTRHKAPLAAELRQGWREFTARQWLWVITLQYTAVVAATTAYAGVIGPLFADHGNGGSRAWGIMAGCQALGTLLGGALAARLHPERPILVAVLATAPLAGPMLCVGLDVPWPLVAATMLGAGVCQTTFGVLWSTTVQNDVPADALSRVASWDLLGVLALAPLGLLIAGPLTTAVGLSITATAAAALILAATAAALLSPQVRQLRAPTPQQSAATPVSA
ncbi:MFS transporter [Actinomadura fibrosa]|uniref:MFS transporter n=1 Tax=Actinomadura fibrosa TaxID=111802 RepID=A0ABW2XS96_9ACTN|nr:MFS transporter [Actinomadura fibrosa]